MMIRLILAVGLLAGCAALAPPKPEPEKAALAEMPDSIPHAQRQAGTLIVLPTEAGAAYDTTRMAYAERPYQLAYYRDHEWAEPPPQMLHRLLVRVLEQTGGFRLVLTAPEGAGSGFVLRTEILELLQDESQAPPLLRLGLRLELRNAAGRSVASRDIRIEEPMRAATPAAGIVAANDAAAKALRQIADFLLAQAR